MRVSAVVGILAVVLVLAAVPVGAQLHEQPLDLYGTAWASQNDTTPGGYGPFATCYDDFQLGSTALVGRVSWYGNYNGLGSISQFTLTFWSDASGQPGSLLSSHVIPGNANEIFIQPNVYHYSATLSSPFQAIGGTRYWLSIVPDMPFPPQWFWWQGTGGNYLFWQDWFGSRYPRDPDLAFRLDGPDDAPVPEASSMAAFASFMGLGLAGLRRLRKR